MPIDPMSLPFCVLFQSRTVTLDTTLDKERKGMGKRDALTVESEESERELDAGEDGQEKEVQPLQRFEKFDAGFDVAFRRTAVGLCGLFGMFMDPFVGLGGY